MENQFNPGGKGKYFRLFPLFAAGFLFLGGWIVMLLWNAIIPFVIPAVHALNYFQAVGMLLLCRLLTGSFKRPGGNYFQGAKFRDRPDWKEKMMHMTEEEKQKFRDEWKKRCGRS